MQKKKLSRHLQVTRRLHAVHLINQKNEWDYYRRKDCMEMFCKDLRNQATKIINYEKKEMIRLTYEETKSYEKQKVCYICKKKI